ncbi:MAG TPA: hypothetical protein VNA24_26660, partial [Hyalangium sp.]|nr:hypothetical protein [Hyalangium sp.]
LVVGVAVVVASCIKPTWPASAPLENDRSIAFPDFHSAVEIGGGTTPYELDGVVLKAIMIAMKDYVRPEDKDQTCWGSPEAHRFRVIRQGGIIFVRIDEDLEFCGLQYLSLDSGAKYAISTDGRILRRVFDGGPERGFAPVVPDAGGQQETVSLGQQDGGGAPVNLAIPNAAPSVLDGGSPYLP